MAGGHLSKYDEFYCSSSKTAVHEVGHLLGMEHDFECLAKQTCNTAAQRLCKSKSSGTVLPMKSTNEKCCNGFMQYGKHPNVWSSCSVRDFRLQYRLSNWGNGCLSGKHFMR